MKSLTKLQLPVSVFVGALLCTAAIAKETSPVGSVSWKKIVVKQDDHASVKMKFFTPNEHAGHAKHEIHASGNLHQQTSHDARATSNKQSISSVPINIATVSYPNSLSIEPVHNQPKTKTIKKAEVQNSVSRQPVATKVSVKHTPTMKVAQLTKNSTAQKQVLVKPQPMAKPQVTSQVNSTTKAGAVQKTAHSVVAKVDTTQVQKETLAFSTPIPRAKPVTVAMQQNQLQSEPVKIEVKEKTQTSKSISMSKHQNGEFKAKETNGHNVSLNFQHIKTRVLLQLLAKTSGLNFIISESVKGTMTLHLNDVPWKQALKIILKANGLDMRRFDNVILIAPIQELADNEINELLARQKVAQLAPLQSEIMTLNYANAEEIATILKGSSNTILSSRGQVGVDTRTNSLWLRDLGKNLDEIRYYVRKLDVPAKQVLIEAKIVKIGTQFTRDLGVRFGVSRPGRLAGTLLKADGTSGSPTNMIDAVKDRLNFNIPSGLEGAGSIALSLIKVGSKNFLDLELSALEEEDHAETIASPRLITSNQKEAIIEQGEEIPYLSAASSGATSIEFKKAVLSLKITPQITPDRNIILQLKVTQDTRGKQIVLTSDDAEALSSQLLPPAINTEQIESHVFLKNGQTIVIGGIFMRENNDSVRRVPFFGNLPVVGALFRNKVHENAQNELLVFITPRIIDRGYMGPKYSHRYCGERKYKDI